MSTPIKPAIVSRNYLADSGVTITCANADLNFPAANAVQTWPAKPVRSRYRTFDTPTLYIRFRYQDGTHAADNYTATISAGVRRPAAFASAVEDAMCGAVKDDGTTYLNVSTIWCLHDTINRDNTAGTNKFTIATSGTLLTLYWSTWPAGGAGVKGSSAGPVMGFDCSQDSSGALTYTAENASTSTFGTITITASNKVLIVSGTTVTMTEGTYNCRTICAHLKAAIDTARTANDNDVQYVEGVGFKFKERNANPPWGFGDVSTTCEDVFGYTVSQTPGTNVYTTPVALRIHTEFTIKFQLPIAQSGQVLALIQGDNGNIQSTATVKAQSSTNGSTWTDEVTFTYDSSFGHKLFLAIQDSPNSRVYWQFIIIDKDNPDGFISFGMLIVGEYYKSRRAENSESDESHVQVTDSNTSKGGNIATSLNYDAYSPKKRMMFVSESEWFGFWETFRLTNGTFKPFLWIGDYQNNPVRDTWWVKFQAWPKANRVQGRAAAEVGSHSYHLDLDFEEVK